MSEVRPASRVVRLRHETIAREVRVTRVAHISPHVRSVTFEGPALAQFDSASFDDHVKFVLDLGDGLLLKRDYTPRHYDRAACEVTIEFALHGDGHASRWAAQAESGQRAVIAGPKSSFIVPLDYDWHLLVGDESALPAIARRLEQLPSSTKAIVLLHATDSADRRALPSAAATSLQWCASDRELLAAVQELVLPAGEGYAWCAGEAAVMTSMRQVLLAKGMERHAMRVSAYWKRGAPAHHATLDA